MSQTRTLSAVEAATSVGAGFLLSLGMQAFLFPAVGLQATLMQNLKLAVGFTALSLLRGYVIRRVFERLGRRHPPGGGSKSGTHSLETGRLGKCTCGHISDRGSVGTPDGAR
ncbi:DUF7220 family protein [Roseivivax sediminis]|uniref:Uncharacterized protein n=1 Tax=Roseivivax sediminis TaxID=936889 RepID=A0A1I1SI55_9RHOB|nr:hypothetical protein [Roseivivax sediminis]SFD42730.1 hypothetical protein SAMN04515678_10129 [Roseivivax sediminis]